MDKPQPNLLGEWLHEVKSKEDAFINGIPKVELHIHIEGTMTPLLRWNLAQKYGLKVLNPVTGAEYKSMEEMKITLYPLLSKVSDYTGQPPFFKSYYDGCEVLQSEDDFYQLAMGYFRQAAEMNIRYCEVFFDPQAHTRRGVKLETLMNGLKRARDEAIKLKVQCNYVCCMCRDLSIESALEHYTSILPYRDIVIGIGLDSLEAGRPPILFEPLFSRAREDGFKITCHCDVGQKDTLVNIDQVLRTIGGGSGADRCDHGLSAARDPDLVKAIHDRQLGLTLCPWSNILHPYEQDIMDKYRLLFDAGIKIMINSDDPCYFEDTWLTDNLKLVRKCCNFTDADIALLQLNAVDISWTTEELKQALRLQIRHFCGQNGVTV